MRNYETRRCGHYTTSPSGALWQTWSMERKVAVSWQNRWLIRKMLWMNTTNSTQSVAILAGKMESMADVEACVHRRDRQQGPLLEVSGAYRSIFLLLW